LLLALLFDQAAATMSNIKRFPGKLKGAKAISFAHVCGYLADPIEMMDGLRQRA
jgi:hypothetical protein